MWKFEHSVECQVSRDFAWQFWTNVDNWVLDPSVESVKLNGSFAAGTKGTTKPRDLDPVDWQLTEVQDRSSAVIEIPAPGAIVRFSGGSRILPAGVHGSLSRSGSKVSRLLSTRGK